MALRCLRCSTTVAAFQHRNERLMKLTVLMLGAGTQSTTMALMAAAGDFGAPPDYAMFNDTGDESAATYRVLDWVTSQLPFPVVRTTAGVELSTAMHTRKRPSGGKVIDAPPDAYAIPAFTVDTTTGEKGMSRRYCTSEYKVKPGDQKMRELLGVKKGERVGTKRSVECWWGYSFDELARCSNPKHHWQTYRWPLIEMRLKREDVLNVYNTRFKTSDAPQLTRSACVYCPYKTPSEWQHLAKTEPDSLRTAANLEMELQKQAAEVCSTKTPYLHRRRIPLLQALEADQQQAKNNPTLFTDSEWGDHQCGGGCGL